MARRKASQIARTLGANDLTAAKSSAKPSRKAAAPAKPQGLTFQDLIFKLEKFWTDKGCILQQPYDVEVGAGTMHPETFLRVLGPEPYKVFSGQPNRPPADGPHGQKPNRLFKHHQLQVILKPTPTD